MTFLIFYFFGNPEKAAEGCRTPRRFARHHALGVVKPVRPLFPGYFVVKSRPHFSFGVLSFRAIPILTPLIYGDC
jgi:hypothetical protein